jgi:hypothetical protein
MKNITLFVVLTFTCVFTNGQNLIGYKSNEIQKYMKENHQDMNSEKVTNASFNYLRYSDNFDSKTLLFFLNNDSICKSIKMICDKNIKEQILKEFNSLYKPDGEYKWIDSRDGKNYHVEIRDEKWSFDVIIEPDK